MIIWGTNFTLSFIEFLRQMEAAHPILRGCFDQLLGLDAILGSLWKYHKFFSNLNLSTHSPSFLANYSLDSSPLRHPLHPIEIANLRSHVNWEGGVCCSFYSAWRIWANLMNFLLVPSPPSLFVGLPERMSECWVVNPHSSFAILIESPS